MSDTPSPWWETLRSWVRYHLALLAVRVLGPAELYWSCPTEWDAYLSEGNDAVKIPEDIRDTIYAVLCEAEYRVNSKIERYEPVFAWLDDHTVADPPESEQEAPDHA